MIYQGYSNEISKNEMLESNAPGDGSMYMNGKNFSEEVDSKM